MAVMTLLPDDTGAGTSSDWIAVGESTRHEALASNDDGTSYVKCDDNNEYMIIEYANPSVAEGDIASIESVSFVSVGKSAHRTNSALITIAYEAPVGVSAYAQICSYDAHRTNWENINGTARTTSDGSNAWTYSDLEGLEMKCTKLLTTEVHFSYLALKITYTEAAVAADNATFFGANF
jgi:hypothetical protein